MEVRRVRVRGRVQGVGFRAWTARQAAALGLAGWVRNRADGSVEAVIGGDADAMAEMLRRLRRGPPLAAVEAVEEEDGPAELPTDFEQRASV